MKKNKLNAKEFAKIFKTTENKLPDLAKKVIRTSDFSYRNTDQETEKKAIIKTVETLLDPTVKVSGPQRKKDWERGWLENFNNFEKMNSSVKELIPKFVRKEPLIRLLGRFIETSSDDFETNFVKVLRYYLFSRYFRYCENIYEFGVGTGLNLVATSELFPNKKLIGLDWAKATCKIIKAINEKLGLSIACKVFNLFEPDPLFRLEKKSAVFTIGTLEQLGEEFRPFIKFLLKNKPDICINIETLYELYDENNLLDFLAKKYLEKRNYLRGFIPYLEELEKKKKVKILKINRTFGAFYHEGYSFVIWKPIND